MSDKNFYDRYWKKEKDEGVESPPIRILENNLYHYDFFKKYIGKKVLDLGGGDGTFINFIREVHKEKADYHCVDISPNAIELGINRFKKIKFFESSIEELSETIKERNYDTVFAVEVLEHIIDIERALIQISKVMKKRGFLCITTTDYNLLKKVIISLFFWDKYFIPTTPHIRFFTKATLKKVCEEHGFKLIEYKWNKSYFGIMPLGQMMIVQKV